MAITATAQTVIKTGRDAVFFDRVGLEHLPVVLFWTQVGQVVGAYLHLRAIRRWGARRVRVGLFLLAAPLFAGFGLFADGRHRAAMNALYLLFPIVFAALFSSAWLLAGDLLEGEDQDALRKAYGRIGAGGTLGWIAGGCLAGALAAALPPAALVIGGALLLTTVAVLCAAAHRRSPLPAAPPPEPRGELPISPDEIPPPIAEAPAAAARSPLLQDPYTRVVFAVSGLSGLIGLLVEFQFYASATANGAANARFFAVFNVALGLASLALQLALAPLIQARWGIGGALLVLPAGVLGAAGVCTMTTFAMAQSVLRVAESGLRASIHQTTWEQLFLPYDRERRSVLKLLVDGVVSRIAMGLGAIGLFVWIRAAGSTAGYAALSWVILAGAAIWIGLTVYLRRRSCAADPGEGEYDPMIRLPDA